MSILSLFTGRRWFTVIGTVVADETKFSVLPGSASVTLYARNPDHAVIKAQEVFNVSNGFWSDRFLRVSEIVEHGSRLRYRK